MATCEKQRIAKSSLENTSQRMVIQHKNLEEL